mgnify:CR=1 FL=1
MKYVTSLNNMTQISTEISKGAQRLGNCSVAAKSVRVNYAGINATISRISQEIEAHSRIMCQMSEVLMDGNRTYALYEENLTEMKRKSLEFQRADYVAGSAVEMIETYKDDQPRRTIADYIPTITKFVGEIGVVGGVIGAVTTWFCGKATPKEYITGGKYLLKAVGTGAVGLSKGGTDGAKYLAGWYNAFGEIDTSSFGKAFKSSLVKQKNQMDLSKATNVGTKVRAVTKWAGHLLTIGGNIYDNYLEREEDGISTGRMWGETLIESGVDIAVGFGATALSTAAIAAIGLTAPAAVVGLGAVGITVGANAICKWATGGKDLGEAAADSVFWIGEKAVDGAQWIGEKVSDGYQVVKKGVTSMITAPWRGICNMFA